MKKNLSSLLQSLAEQVPAGELRLDDKTLQLHGGDKWLAFQAPQAVALPRSVESVQTILAFAHEHRIPVTPRGSGYGYVGGCVPVQGGIVLSLARMNRIKQVHAKDFVAVVQPGVLTATLQDRVKKQGLFYPPDPASRADCSIGGNVATNAGGPSCLKYGVTRDYVLGLEVVLADGSLAHLGSRTHKNKTGFDLTKLMVGSEGMLGVVTEATLKLIPLPPYRACLGVGFAKVESAIQAIHQIFASGILPCALEIADEYTLNAAYRRTKNDLLKGCSSHLIVELDGQEQSVRHEIQNLQKLLQSLSPQTLTLARGAEECDEIWKIRREFSYSLRDMGLKKFNEDVVVPRSRLSDLFRFAQVLQKKYNIPIACFGHAGDGNIHVNLMVDETQSDHAPRRDAALDELFRKILSWNGVITGEHGIGLAKKPWWNLATDPATRAMHASVKKALDPRHILNPGKFIP